MVIIQLQVGKNTIRIFIRWRNKCKYHSKKPQNKIRFAQTKISPIPPQNGKLEYNQTFKNRQAGQLFTRTCTN